MIPILAYDRTFKKTSKRAPSLDPSREDPTNCTQRRGELEPKVKTQSLRRQESKPQRRANTAHEHTVAVGQVGQVGQRPSTG